MKHQVVCLVPPSLYFFVFFLDCFFFVSATKGHGATRPARPAAAARRDLLLLVVFFFSKSSLRRPVFPCAETLVCCTFLVVVGFSRRCHNSLCFFLQFLHTTHQRKKQKRQFLFLADADANANTNANANETEVRRRKFFVFVSFVPKNVKYFILHRAAFAKKIT